MAEDGRYLPEGCHTGLKERNGYKMPWCPKCKNEYVEGIKVCADCGVELIDSLKKLRSNPVIFGEEEQMERLKEFLKYSGIKSAEVAYDEEDGVFELYVEEEERQKASMAVGIFLQQEEKKEKERILSEQSLMPEIASDIPQRPPVPVYRGVYQDSAKKAEENRSSAYMLMIIGGIGLVVILLIFMDIISLPINKYLMCGVMGGLFAVFVVMGILSLKSSKVLEKKAESENNLTTEIKKWAEFGLTAQLVDEGLFEEGEVGDEIRYFKRSEKMKQMISYQFMNLDEGFLEAFVDDYYPVLFEQGHNS